jgi:hypothetical protein
MHVFMGFELMIARGGRGIDDQCNLLLFSLYIDWRVDTAALQIYTKAFFVQAALYWGFWPCSHWGNELWIA